MSFLGEHPTMGEEWFSQHDGLLGVYTTAAWNAIVHDLMAQPGISMPVSTTPTIAIVGGKVREHAPPSEM